MDTANLIPDIDKEGENCVVCGKKAQGLHYAVPTCHGCKSFFRRTLLRELTFPKCWRSEKCYSNVSPSSKPLKCRACRYQKCLDVGMVPLFTTERKKQEELPDIIDIDEPGTSQEVQIIRRIQVDDPVRKMESFVMSLSHLEEQLTKIRLSKFNPIHYPTLENLIQSPSLLAYASNFKPMPGWPLTTPEFFQKQRQLTSSKIMIENGQLDEASASGINTKEWPPFEMMMAVEYAKTFPFFAKLSFADKLCLIRGTAFMTYVTTTTFNSYKAGKEVLTTPDGVCMNEPSNKHIVEHHLRTKINKTTEQSMYWKFILRGLEPLVRDKFDKSEYILLKAIIATNPALDLSQEGQKIVQEERNKYARALLDLCLLNYGRVNGPSRFLTVLNYISVMEDYQRDYRDFLTHSQLFTPTPSSKSRRKLENAVLCIEIKENV